MIPFCFEPARGTVLVFEGLEPYHPTHSKIHASLQEMVKRFGNMFLENDLRE
jgi:hypothetical protein